MMMIMIRFLQTFLYRHLNTPGARASFDVSLRFSATAELDPEGVSPRGNQRRTKLILFRLNSWNEERRRPSSKAVTARKSVEGVSCCSEVIGRPLKGKRVGRIMLEVVPRDGSGLSLRSSGDAGGVASSIGVKKGDCGLAIHSDRWDMP